MPSEASVEAALKKLAASYGLSVEVPPGLLAALVDPAPWQAVPEVGTTATLCRVAWGATHHLPFCVRLRLVRVSEGDRSPRIATMAREVSWGLVSIEEYDAAFVLSGLPVQVGRVTLLADLGRVVRWLPADDVRLSPAAWREHGELLLLALKTRLKEIPSWANPAHVAMAILGRMDAPPAGTHAALRERMLTGSSEQERALAAQLVGTGPEVVGWVLERLRGGTAGARLRAVHWALVLGGPEAREALVAAARKERVEAVRIAQLRALQVLGVDPGEVLDREQLAVELQKKAKKGTLPPDFELADLPELRWTDGTPVSPDIVLAWVSTCHKRKKADPSPMLALLAAGVEPASGAAFARALVEVWVALDDPDHVTFDGRPVGRGTEHKGLLALAAALGDGSLLEPARRYITHFYGWRAAQSKAMVTMLAHVGEPRTLQYLIQLAMRFRTRGIQKQARIELDGVAARRGWTSEELADRTLDDGGLGPTGALELVYRAGGAPSRVFVLGLGSSVALVLRDSTGKVLRGLPKAWASEDEDSVKAAKKALSTARRSTKAFFKVQLDRLHTAMVSQRTWSAELFSEVMLAHPLLGPICQRLIWVDAEGRSFRPTDDGTCTDLDDETVVLPADAQVAIAHPLVLGPQLAAAWGEHLSDYELISPFEQLGRPTWRPTEAEATAMSLDDLSGVRVNGLSLRSRAARLGYDLGPTEGGGYVSSLQKELPSLSLTVCIEVADLRLPVEDSEVGLAAVFFVQAGQRLPLSGVPPVLLSEVKADLAALRPEPTA